MPDARFEDADEGPLALRAETPEDLGVIAALVQDAVLPASELRWAPRARQFSCLINRFRWEDKTAAEAAGRPYERVQSLLVVSDVLGVASQGIDRQDRDTVYALLDLTWTPGEDGAGRLELILAGDGAIALSAECLAVDLRDVTRPYAAVSGHAPHHPE